MKQEQKSSNPSAHIPYTHFLCKLAINQLAGLWKQIILQHEEPNPKS